MDPSPSTAPIAPRPATPWSHKALWFISAGLLANAAVMLYTSLAGHAPDLLLERGAFAQALAPNPTGTLLGARGIYMMPAQLGPQTYGLYLMDVDAGTICVYRTNLDGTRFRLVAARSFKYDRFLEDFNNESPKPKEVQKLIDEQRQRLDLQTKTDQPTVDQSPKPDDNQPITPQPPTTPRDRP